MLSASRANSDVQVGSAITKPSYAIPTVKHLVKRGHTNNSLKETVHSKPLEPTISDLEPRYLY